MQKSNYRKKLSTGQPISRVNSEDGITNKNLPLPMDDITAPPQLPNDDNQSLERGSMNQTNSVSMSDGGISKNLVDLQKVT